MFAHCQGHVVAPAAGVWGESSRLKRTASSGFLALRVSGSGTSTYFRMELAWAKLLGIVLLLAPVPARLEEWAYAGFAITLGSALIAHVSIGEGPEGVEVGRGYRCAVGTLVLLLEAGARRQLLLPGARQV